LKKQISGVKRPLPVGPAPEVNSGSLKTPKLLKGTKSQQLMIQINLEKEPEETPPVKSVETMLVSLLEKYKQQLLICDRDSLEYSSTEQKINIIAQLIKIQSMSFLKE
jgi:hypothetical protein